jgi:hypothetical protein
MPEVAAAIDAQIDCDDASDDFIKEKLHSNIRSSRDDWAALRIDRQSYGSHCIRATWFECDRIWCWFNCKNDRGKGIAEPKVLRFVTR